MKKEIKLVNDTISNKDIDRLVEWLKTYPRLTKGEKTLEFEKKWSEWLGVKHSVFVNSGSSANLMMLYALKLAKKLRNNTVVVPALSWATDLAPVIQLGFKPKLVDANKENLSVDTNELEQIFKIEAPAALILVSVLGLPPNMTEIQHLCKKYGVYLLEDVCESLGSKHNGQKLGTFGEMSSFSLYFGHHMSCTPSTPIPFLDKNGLFGIEPISEIYDNYKDKLSDMKILCFDKITKNIKYKTPSNVVRHNVGKKDLLSIKLRNGRAVEITEDHSVFRFGEDETPEEVMGCDIQIGDKIVVPKYISNPPEISKINLLDFVKDTKNVFVLNYPKQNLRNIKCHWKSKMSKSKANYSTRKTIPIEFMTEFDENCKIGFRRQRKHNYIPCQIEITPAFARILGFFMAEGSYFDHGLMFSFNINEKDVVDSLIKDINYVFGLDSKIVLNEKDNGMSVKVCSKMLKHFFQEILKIKSGARNKRVPNIVFHFNEKCKVSYLYGHFTGDGTLDGIRLSVASASLSMINDISYLCSMMGLSGSVQEVDKPCGEKIIKNKKTKSFGVFCFRLYNIKFTEEGTVEIIDTNRTSSHKRCKDGCGDLFDLKVEKIEKINENIEHVYDFSVNNDENFIGGLQPICLHNSTIEGGMVCTNDDELYNILKMIRSHGWSRDLDEESQKKLKEKWGTDDFSALYTFYVPGFNLRSTDLQAYIGIGQLEKLEDIVNKRHQNFCHFEKLLKGNTSWWPKIPFSDFISSFCIPIIFDNIAWKEMAVREFNDNNIEVRPLIAGSMGAQPFYVERYGIDEKPFCSIIDKRGIYVPNHPCLEFEDIKRICDIILKYN